MPVLIFGWQMKLPRREGIYSSWSAHLALQKTGVGHLKNNQVLCCTTWTQSPTSKEEKPVLGNYNIWCMCPYWWRYIHLTKIFIWGCLFPLAMDWVGDWLLIRYILLSVIQWNKCGDSGKQNITAVVFMRTLVCSKKQFPGILIMLSVWQKTMGYSRGHKVYLTLVWGLRKDTVPNLVLKTWDLNFWGLCNVTLNTQFWYSSTAPLHVARLWCIVRHFLLFN